MTDQVNAVTPDQPAEHIPYEDFDALAKWALEKVAAGEMSYGRLSLLFDCVEYRARKGCADEPKKPTIAELEAMLADTRPHRIEINPDGSISAVLEGAAAITNEGWALAQKFHEIYERLAPSFGYETRAESAKPWEGIPFRNKQLMAATCTEILKGAGSAETGGEKAAR